MSLTMRWSSDTEPRMVCASENQVQRNLDTSNCRGPPKMFELWVMLSLCFSHVATVASPFRFSVFHFLAKLSKICEIFFSCKKKNNEVKFVTRECTHISHRKGNLVTLTTIEQFQLWLKVRDIPCKLSFPRQRPWNLVWIKQVFWGRVNRVSLYLTWRFHHNSENLVREKTVDVLALSFEWVP